MTIMTFLAKKRKKNFRVDMFDGAIVNTYNNNKNYKIFAIYIQIIQYIILKSTYALQTA